MMRTMPKEIDLIRNGSGSVGRRILPHVHPFCAHHLATVSLCTKRCSQMTCINFTPFSINSFYSSKTFRRKGKKRKRTNSQGSSPRRRISSSLSTNTSCQPDLKASSNNPLMSNILPNSSLSSL